MKITCQSCQSKYNVADEKVQGKIVKIRCRKCGSTIVVQGNGGATTNGSSATSGGATGEADAAVQWHVNVGEGEPRTMTIGELVDSYNAGSITQDTFIWTDGMEDWKPLSEVEPVVSALHAAGAPEPAAKAEPAAAHRAPSVDPPDEVTYAAQSPLAALEPAPEPRRAAVAKRDARARDLFGTGVAAEEVQTSAPAVPQMMSSGAIDDASKMTGQRNENSVLFSLAVLTKDADGRAEEEAPRPTTSRNNEDSGLIDLKALAAKAESMRPGGMSDANPFASPLGLGSAPLGAPMSVLGGPLGEAPPKSKLPLIIGGGAGIALLLVLGIVIGVKLAGNNAPVPDASATASAMAPAPTATAEPSATASATATAEASASAPTPAASVAAKPKPAYGGGAVYHPSAATKSTSAATAAAATPAATPPPPKKAGTDCGCNGDLMCLMKCSTH